VGILNLQSPHQTVEDDSQKIQEGNGQENHVAALFKGFENALF
jgi:hypothetical protein